VQFSRKLRIIRESLTSKGKPYPPCDMNLTDYHAKYFAYELTKRCSSDSVDKLASAVAGAQLDLNPHHRRKPAGI
jgi:hypothetical protein